jgi:hypothetical protein
MDDLYMFDFLSGKTLLPASLFCHLVYQAIFNSRFSGKEEIPVRVLFLNRHGLTGMLK